MKPAFVFALSACVALACGASRQVGDAARDAAAGSDVRGDAASDVATDVPSEAALAPTGLPLPDGVAPPVLLDETATLTGAGRTACSHQQPASGDGARWCAFRRKGATAGSTELWVMNVSVAARGAVPPCDGSSASCLRLTTTLWPSYGNDFEGDTLIFYADAPPELTSAKPFLGPIYAWRPGWSRTRQLAAHGSLCEGHRNAAVALCFDDPSGKPDNPDDVQLRVGVVADVSDSVLPALPGRWPLRTDGSVPWQIFFSPDGETFAISLKDATGVGQTLSVIGTREIVTGTLRDHVLDAIGRWTLSNDGKKIFFYRGPANDKTLSSADFPAGTGERLLATKVVEYVALGRRPTDLALLLRVVLPDGGHAFRLLRDRERPDTAVTVFMNDGFLEGVAIAPDLRYAAWLDGEFRGTAIRVEDGASCPLNPAPAPTVAELAFLDDASLMFWSERRPGLEGIRDGVFAPPDRCAERTIYARDLGLLSPIGHRGIVFGDESDENVVPTTVTLKYAGFAGGLAEATAGGVRVRERVATPITLAEDATAPGSLHIVYRADPTSTQTGGIYLFAAPF